jgi:hypothetical protein
VPDLPDISTPVPDAGHEDLRLRLVAALADITDHLEQLADSFLLGQTAADFAQTVLTNFTALQAVVTDQATAIGDLTARVTALENPTDPPPPAA